MMRDQAEGLRLRLQRLSSEAKTLAVVSGKGGVGKSNFSLNFALHLAKENKRVLLFDMDIGMGNIDILLGTTSKYTIIDIFNSDFSINDIINVVTENFCYISGGTAFTNFFKFDHDKINYLLNQIQLIMPNFDYFIFDMGAGLTEENLRFLLSVDDIIVITTPEPTAIMDSYAAMKHICLNRFQVNLSIIVNRITSSKEGNVTYQRLSNAMSQFLKKDVTLLGLIPEDKDITKAVSLQTPITYFNEHSKGSTAIKRIVNRYIAKIDMNQDQKSSTFISKLRKLFLER